MISKFIDKFIEIASIVGMLLLCALGAGLLIATLGCVFVGPFFGFWTAFMAFWIVAFLLFCVWGTVHFIDNHY